MNESKDVFGDITLVVVETYLRQASRVSRAVGGVL